MNSSISERISEAEENWLELVIPYIARLFGKTFIPSHDQDHHQRVWRSCKNLLMELEKFSSLASKDQVEGLLLASWFHDTGLVSDPGELHGAIGREIFQRFLLESGRQKPALYEEISDVIAHHDTKERSLYPDIAPGTAPGMMGILSLADDLDALGALGIYRYSEIYLKRGLPAGELGIKILANVRKRLKNIRDSTAAFPGLTDTFLDDYLMLEQFFNRYNQLIVIFREPGSVQWGELGVVNHIRAFTVEGEIRPGEFIFQPGLASSGQIVNNYFKKLHEELELKSQ